MKKQCMDFTNREIEEYLLRRFGNRFKYKLLVGDVEVGLDCEDRYEFIMLDEEKDFYIDLLGFQTSVFIHNEEFMFIDDSSKEQYTESDTYGNVVYEGELASLSHEQILTLLYEIVIILADSDFMEISCEPMNADNGSYPKYLYTIKLFGDDVNVCERYFTNIRFRLLNSKK